MRASRPQTLTMVVKTKTNNRRGLFYFFRNKPQVLALVKGIKKNKPIETNAGRILHALLKGEKNSINNKHLPLDTSLALGNNPARTWRRLRDHGIIKVSKNKRGRHSVDLSLAEAFLPLRTIYRSMADTSPITNFMTTAKFYNSFTQNHFTITKAISQTESEKEELRQLAIAYFLALKKLPEKVRGVIEAFLNHEVLMLYVHGEKVYLKIGQKNVLLCFKKFIK